MHNKRKIEQLNIAQQLENVADYLNSLMEKDANGDPTGYFHPDVTEREFKTLETVLKNLNLQPIDKILNISIKTAKSAGMIKNNQTQKEENVFAAYYTAVPEHAQGGQNFDGSRFDPNEDFGAVIKKAYSVKSKEDGVKIGMTRNQACLAATDAYTKAMKKKAGIDADADYRGDLITNIIEVGVNRQLVHGGVNGSISFLKEMPEATNSEKIEETTIKAVGQLAATRDGFRALANIIRYIEKTSYPIMTVPAFQAATCQPGIRLWILRDIDQALKLCHGEKPRWSFFKIPPAVLSVPEQYARLQQKIVLALASDSLDEKSTAGLKALLTQVNSKIDYLFSEKISPIELPVKVTLAPSMTEGAMRKQA
jgi:hypothetical protein